MSSALSRKRWIQSLLHHVALVAALAKCAGAISLDTNSLTLGAVPDACSCLNWKETYSSGLSGCGGGHELFLATKDGAPLEVARQTLGPEFCDRFFAHVDDNVCMNVNWGPSGEWYSGQWCYVSHECESGIPANGTNLVRVKYCSTGQDIMLRDKSPEELFSYAEERDIGIGFIAKMAYPVEKDLLPMYVKAFFGLDSDVRVPAPRLEKLKKIQELRDSGKAVVLDSLNGVPPFAVIQGQRTYLVDRNAEADSKHWSSLSTWSCIGSCDDS